MNVVWGYISMGKVMKFKAPETASGGHVLNESYYSTVGIEFYWLNDYCTCYILGLLLSGLSL